MNLCRRNEYETTLLCEKIRDEVYKKHMKNLEPAFWHLTTVALDGLKCVDPLIDIDAFLLFFYQVHNDKCKETYFKNIRYKVTIEFREHNFFSLYIHYNY